MIESIYLALFIIGVLLTLYSIKIESKVYCILGVIIWLILLVESLNIQTFYIAYTFNGTDYNSTIAYMQKSEWGLSAFCLAFIFINIIYALVLQFDWRRYLK